MRIERVEAVPVRLGFRGTFATSRGVVGAADAGAEHVVVKVTAADGTVGWGEVRPSRRWSDETQETVWSTINRYFAPALVGRDVFDAVGHDQALSAEIAPHFTLGQPLARGGGERAVWGKVGQLVACRQRKSRVAHCAGPSAQSARLITMKRRSRT